MKSLAAFFGFILVAHLCLAAAEEVQFLGGTIGDVSDKNITNAFDGDLTTSATGYPNEWVGLYTTNPCLITRLRFAPEPSTVGEYYKETYMAGVSLQVSTNNFSNYATIDTLPTNTAYPWYPRYQFTERMESTTTSNSYYRLYFPSWTGVAEIEFIGTGTTNARPVAPDIKPWGGRFTSGSALITLTSLTTSAQIYYTLDGTAPTTNSLTYSGPFVLNITSNINFQAMAYDASLLVPCSEISSNAFFASSGWVPLDNWRDDQGVLVEAHGGCLLDDRQNGNGFLWYGDFCNMGESPPNIYKSAGTCCYQSGDLLNWTNKGQVSALPSSWSFNYRPKVIYNEANRYYVLWEYFQIGSGASAMGVATSSVPFGPFTWVTTDAQPWGGTSATGPGDFNVFLSTDQTAYLVGTSNPPIGGIFVRKLDSTYTNWTADPPVPITSNYREAPILFIGTNGTFFCIHSEGNYYDSTSTYNEQYAYCTNATPLGTWHAGGNLFASDPVDLPTTPPNLFNGQSEWVFKSPWNINQWIYASDFWYNGSTPLWNIYSNSYESGVNGTLYDSRQIWLPMVQTGSTSIEVSTNADWYLQDGAPRILAQPQNQLALAGSSATFSVIATGLSLSYQWYLDGTTAIPGATNDSLTLTNLNASQTGNGYSASVYNPAGVVTSSNAILTVIQPVNTSITGINAVGTNISVMVLSESGVNYLLQYKNSLSDPSWTPLPPATPGTGTNILLTDHSGNFASRFYRVIVQ